MAADHDDRARGGRKRQQAAGVAQQHDAFFGHALCDRRVGGKIDRLLVHRGRMIVEPGGDHAGQDMADFRVDFGL